MFHLSQYKYLNFRFSKWENLYWTDAEPMEVYEYTYVERIRKTQD